MSLLPPVSPLLPPPPLMLLLKPAAGSSAPAVVLGDAQWSPATNAAQNQNKTTAFMVLSVSVLKKRLLITPSSCHSVRKEKIYNLKNSLKVGMEDPACPAPPRRFAPTAGFYVRLPLTVAVFPFSDGKKCHPPTNTPSPVSSRQRYLSRTQRRSPGRWFICWSGPLRWLSKTPCLLAQLWRRYKWSLCQHRDALPTTKSGICLKIAELYNRIK